MQLFEVTVEETVKITRRFTMKSETLAQAAADAKSMAANRQADMANTGGDVTYQCEGEYPVAASPIHGSYGVEVIAVLKSNA